MQVLTVLLLKLDPSLSIAPAKSLVGTSGDQTRLHPDLASVSMAPLWFKLIIVREIR